MLTDDRSYYRHRAEVEIQRARQAAAPHVVRVHQELAEAYLAKLAMVEPVGINAS